MEGLGADAVFGQCWADVEDSVADKGICAVVKVCLDLKVSVLRGDGESKEEEDE